jgi:hypothetical protein
MINNATITYVGEINDYNKLRGYNIGTLFINKKNELYIKCSPTEVRLISNDYTNTIFKSINLENDEFEDYINKILNKDSKAYESRD